MSPPMCGHQVLQGGHISMNSATQKNCAEHLVLALHESRRHGLLVGRLLDPGPPHQPLIPANSWATYRLAPRNWRLSLSCPQGLHQQQDAAPPQVEARPLVPGRAASSAATSTGRYGCLGASSSSVLGYSASSSAVCPPATPPPIACSFANRPAGAGGGSAGPHPATLSASNLLAIASLLPLQLPVSPSHSGAAPTC